MFSINDLIKLKNNNITGIIIRKNYIKHTYLVRLSNNMITNLSEDKLEKFTPQKSYLKTNFKEQKVTFNLDSKHSFEPEIMLRHKYLEEALAELDLFIYQAIANNQKIVKIIHGKNGGILRNGVHKYLKENENVIEFHLGNYFEGSYGVTIATLK
jgi:DNA mismatch repair protein MutS2